MRKVLTAAVLALVIVGCVVIPKEMDIHVTLDIRHIQEQAADVLDFIEGASDALPVAEGEEATSWMRRTLDALDPMPTAHAAELDTVSPMVKEIATRMRSRNSEVSGLKKSGCAGENNRGYLDLRDCADLSDDAKKNDAQKIIADENKDRKALYKEIARLNSEDQDVNVGTVETVYAMEYLNRAKSGEAAQLPPAGKEFNEVKASSLGQRLGAGCQPGAWVTIP